MAARPPKDSNDDPNSIEFGIAALAAHLDDPDVEYPIRSDQLSKVVGDPDIPIDVHGNSISLSKVLTEVDAEQFDSQQDVLNTPHPVFETYRDSAGTGVLASVRSLIPF